VKSIEFIGWAWPVEVAVLVATGILLLAFAPDLMDYYIRMLAPLGLLIGAQGGAAFGGPALKRKQGSEK